MRPGSEFKVDLEDVKQERILCREDSSCLSLNRLFHEEYICKDAASHAEPPLQVHKKGKREREVLLRGLITGL